MESHYLTELFPTERITLSLSFFSLSFHPPQIACPLESRTEQGQYSGPNEDGASRASVCISSLGHTLYKQMSFSRSSDLWPYQLQWVVQHHHCISIFAHSSCPVHWRKKKKNQTNVELKPAASIPGTFTPLAASHHPPFPHYTAPPTADEGFSSRTNLSF